MRHSWIVMSDTATLTGCLAGYARRLHATVGAKHHVASPLGAWLLLALCGPATTGAQRATLAGVLGCDVEEAARLATGLLSSPHPLVAAAAAAWARPGHPLPGVFGQRERPDSVQTGPLPTQAELDDWAREHTFGLIDRFPIKTDPRIYLILATALATRVSWETPFDLAPAAELGAGSAWAGQLGRVLSTPGEAVGAGSAGYGHRRFIAVTPEAGDVIVHLAQARGGLLVASVAAAADVAYGEVLAAAQRIGCAVAAGGSGVVGREVALRRLADLPLGEAPLWVVREEAEAGGFGRDAFTAVLPAWSAQTTLELSDPSLGFGDVAAAVAGPDPWQARQAAMARFSRVGFEAAAVTGFAVAASMPALQPRRAAELRFAHPYAVVAVAMDAAGREAADDPWHGVPVFSAWVADPEDAAGGDASR
jgi:hypothetical protein